MTEKKLLPRFAGVFVLGIAIWLLWPSDIDPAVFHPSAALPMTGALAPNEDLDAVTAIPLEIGFGPEDVAVGADGSLYGGLEEGEIIKVAPDGTQSVLVNTGGRPLGLAWDSAGNLIVADAEKGLLSVSGQGGVHVLAADADGIPFGFTDDVDIGPDGVIYLSDASWKYGKADLYADILETRPYGRLIAYTPATGEIRVLLRDLYFANGVAVDPDGRFVLVNETWAYRVTRYWLKGPKAGTHDVFADRLPGFPDGISAGPDGRFYVAVYAPRNPLVDRVHRSPFLKSLLYKLPGFLQPGPKKYGFVLEMDSDGRIVRSYQDTDGSHAPIITSVEAVEDTLFLGSLIMPQIVIFKPVKE